MKLFGNFWQWVKSIYVTLLVALSKPLVKVSNYFLKVADRLEPQVIEVTSTPVEDKSPFENFVKTVTEPPAKSLKEQLVDCFSTEMLSTRIIDDYLNDRRDKGLKYLDDYDRSRRNHQSAMCSLLSRNDKAGIISRAETTAELHKSDLITNFGEVDDSASFKMHESMKKRLIDIDAKLREATKKGYAGNSIAMATSPAKMQILEEERAGAEKAKNSMESIDAELRNAKNLPKNLRTHAARNARMVEEKTKKSKPKTEQKAKPKTKKAARSTGKKAK